MTSAQSPASQQPQQYPLYGTTYTLHRVSPLYNGSTPILASLAIHARRFRDIIKGDVLRGIQISHDAVAAAAAAAALATGNASSGRKSNRDRGGFKSCSWELLGDENAWARAHGAAPSAAAEDGDDEEDDEMMSNLAHVSVANARGVRIEVVYERATYTALLLGPTASAVGAAQRTIVVRDGFTHLPLLCTKMPAPLREALAGYLSTAFDARVAQMRLGSSLMASVLESVLESTLAPFEEDLRPVTSFSKGLGIQLAFPCTMPELKTMDVTIDRGDLLDFVKHGRRLLSAPSSSARNEPKDLGRGDERKYTGPFMTSLESYLSQHLSLSLSHPAVTIHRISAGPYALSADGKLKMTTPQAESEEVANMIIRAASSTARLATRESVLESAKEAEKGWYNGVRWDVDHGLEAANEHAANDARGGGAGKLRVPSDPPPPYEVHDPALRDELMDDV